MSYWIVQSLRRTEMSNPLFLPCTTTGEQPTFCRDPPAPDNLTHTIEHMFYSKVEATMIHPWNPWHQLRDKWSAITYRPTPSLPGGALGCTDGRNIYIVNGLTMAERRSVLTHELIHLERGEYAHQNACVERLVDQEAARRLIPFENLLEVDWTQPLASIAESLWVDETTLKARLHTLHPEQMRRLGQMQQT